MKKMFYFGLLLLAIFEILNVYFIMPMPGSQEMNSLGIAYFLYSYRWVFRVVFGLMIIFGYIKTWNERRKWLRTIWLLPVLAIVWLFNFKMVADHMFLQPAELILKDRLSNQIPEDRLVIGITNNGEAKAYPVEFLAYHHQVQDSIGGRPVIVTYCSVCRTGRVFEPLVDGRPEKFRLVGMDHFNAMFEDETTGSWWRQVSGEAVTGEHKGKLLPEYPSSQMSLGQWLALYPNSLIMQEDPASAEFYDPEARYEKGLYSGGLTGTDKEAWQNKAWVVGLQVGKDARAYDWNQLVERRVINDQVGSTPVTLVIADDNSSFAAFRHDQAITCSYQDDTLFCGDKKYNFAGVSHDPAVPSLERINAYQEFWHSWQTFHPNTSIYE